MERMLYNAAVEGDVNSLLHLVQQDRLILDMYMVSCFTQTPLHVSALLGHVEFTKEILILKPQLAEELNSQKSTALHLASAKGYVEIVKELLLASSNTCLLQDQDGLNPLHIATIKGRVSVMSELLRARPDAARALIKENNTIFHLCARHNQLDALKLLMETIDHDDEFLNSKDGYGNTILHLAVADKRVEMITYLIKSTTIKVNEPNFLGCTALDVLAQSRRDEKDIDISESLQSVGAVKAVNNLTSFMHEVSSSNSVGLRNNQTDNPTNPRPQRTILEEHQRGKIQWTDKTRNTLMVVASLIATMAFQVGVNTPGGYWQEDSGTVSDIRKHYAGAPKTSNQYAEAPSLADYSNAHHAGEPMWANTHPNIYGMILVSNTTGFVGSLSIILLLISGLPIGHKWFMRVLTLIMWVTVSAMVLTYLLSTGTTYWNPETENFEKAKWAFFYEWAFLYEWALLIGLVLLVHFILLIIRVVKWYCKLIMPILRRQVLFLKIYLTSISHLPRSRNNV